MNNNSMIPTPFDLIFGGRPSPTVSRAVGRTVSMPMDVYQEKDRVVVELEAPGVNAEDFDITCERGVLTVAVEKNSERSEKDGHYLERSYGRISRSVTLGDRVDQNNITAEYRDGVLTVTAPIAEEAKPQRIEVKAITENKAVEAKHETPEVETRRDDRVKDESDSSMKI